MRGLFSLLIVAAGVSVVAGGGGAVAADLGGGPIYEDQSIPLPQAYLRPWYVGVRGGASWFTDSSYDALGTSIDQSYDTGYFFGGMVGYDFNGASPGFRVEAELNYLQADIRSHRRGGTTFNGSSATGDTSILAGFASVYYDLPFSTGITPFVGAGLGIANVDLEDHGIAGPGTFMEDSGNAFAWHVTAGADIAMTDAASLELGYRYLAVEGVDLTAVDGTGNSVDADSHVLFAGVKYRF
jgi:opacity protein-like surface antigen